MHCSACSTAVEAALRALPGVASAEVALLSQQAIVRCAPGACSQEAVVEAVEGCCKSSGMCGRYWKWVHRL
jgi:Cu+-exporting ATPase